MPNGESDSSEVFFYSFFFVCSLFAPHISVHKRKTDIKSILVKIFLRRAGKLGVFCVKLAGVFHVVSFRVVSQEDAAQMWGEDTFSNRQEMCKMMRGFHIRTITINRAMGYIASGDHTK